MDLNAFWELTPSARAEAWSYLPEAIAWMLPFMLCNLLLFPKKPLLALGLSLYAYGCVVPWLYASDFFWYGGDRWPTGSWLLFLFLPALIVGMRVAMEKTVSPSFAVRMALAQLVPAIMILYFGSQF